MPSIQLICQENDFKKEFKEKFKSEFSIFTASSLKDGLRNTQKIEIDLLIIEFNPQRIKSLHRIDSLLRQKNINYGEICIIFLLDLDYLNKPGIRDLLSLYNNFNYFWFGTSAFKSNGAMFMALDLFIKNKIIELNTLRMNYILMNKISMVNQPSLISYKNPEEHTFFGQPVSFLPHNTNNNQYLENIQKAVSHWPITLFRGPEGLEQDSLAAYIHSKNNSKNQMFTVDFSDIPEYFHESILFGLKQKNLPGFKYINNNIFDMAKKGTLYLKNIEHLKWEVQSELFRALQVSHYQRDDLKINVKCRFIFSSTVDLEKYVEKGIFRQDLYSHLAVYMLNIPTLQQRKKDLPLIIDDYINWFTQKFDKKIDLTLESRIMITKNSYPGQFEQFYNYLYNLFSISDGIITPEFILKIDNEPNLLNTARKNITPETSKTELLKPGKFIPEKTVENTQFLLNYLDEKDNLDYSLTDIEREYIKHVMAQNYNNIAETARILGITRKTLYGKLKKYKLHLTVKNTG